MSSLWRGRRRRDNLVLTLEVLPWVLELDLLPYECLPVRLRDYCVVIDVAKINDWLVHVSLLWNVSPVLFSFLGQRGRCLDVCNIKWSSFRAQRYSSSGVCVNAILLPSNRVKRLESILLVGQTLIQFLQIPIHGWMALHVKNICQLVV